MNNIFDKIYYYGNNPEILCQKNIGYEKIKNPKIKKLARDSKRNNYKNFLLLKGNLAVLKNPNFNDLKIDNWKIIMLGAFEESLEDYSKKRYYPFKTWGNFAIAFNENIYDEILDFEDKELSLFYFFEKYFKKCYVITPNIFIPNNSIHKSLKYGWDLDSYDNVKFDQELIFDWKYYINHYQDLNNISSRNKAIKHWIEHGQFENRIYNQQATSERKSKDNTDQKNKPIIQSLWIGNHLSTMEILCIKSFLHHGHDFHLYIYENIDNIPLGTTVKNGNEILSKNFIFKYSQNSNENSTKSFSGFSNIFRYKLLYDKGGYWVDMDMICLKPFNFKDPYIFSSEYDKDTKKQITNAGVIKAPKNNLFCKYALEVCSKKDLNNLKWGEIGPKLVRKSVEHYNLHQYIKKYQHFCPIYYTDLDNIIKKCKTNMINSYAIHLWNDCWKRNNHDKNGDFHLLSIYEKLKKKYLF